MKFSQDSYEVLRIGQNTREGNGKPLQYSCLENFMDGGAWKAAVHGVAKSQAQLSDFTFTFHFHALEKDMATHSSVLAWRIGDCKESGTTEQLSTAQYVYGGFTLLVYPLLTG